MYMNERYFKNRSEAGKRLALALMKYKGREVLVLALPRGGVATAYEVAVALEAPLSVIVARKISAPGNPEFGIGAVAEGDVLILNMGIIEKYDIDNAVLDTIASDEISEMERRITLYRAGEPLPGVKNKTVILVDDGLATGVTAQSALTSLDNMEPAQLIFASPVCSYYSSEILTEYADEIICILKPFDLSTIGNYYQDFAQVTDEEVIELLKKAKVHYEQVYRTQK